MSGWEQASMVSGLSVREKASAGTWMMWLLSQMMRDRETVWRCLLWVLVNTPSLSHQNLEEQRFGFFYLLSVLIHVVTSAQWRILRHLSPSLRSLNCLASRQDSSGPTRPPGRAGSEMPPTHTSILCGVPYRSWNLWAKVRLPRISANSDVVLGTERPQNLRHEPYPGEIRWGRRQEFTALIMEVGD